MTERFYQLSEEEIQVLDRLNNILNLSTDQQTNYAVYHSPAQSLREEAERIEEEDYAIGMFRRLVSRIHAAPATDEDGSSWPPSEPTGKRGDPG